MNNFRMGLLKERAEAIRPDLTKAREITEAAEREHRDLTDEEKAFTEPTIKTAREIADGMKQIRDEDAMMSPIKSEFGDVLGPLGDGTIIWTLPTGRIYRTTPGGAVSCSTTGSRCTPPQKAPTVPGGRVRLGDDPGGPLGGGVRPHRQAGGLGR
jgi:hypothetical protein